MWNFSKQRDNFSKLDACGPEVITSSSLRGFPTVSSWFVPSQGSWALCSVYRLDAPRAQPGSTAAQVPCEEGGAALPSLCAKHPSLPPAAQLHLTCKGTGAWCQTPLAGPTDSSCLPGEPWEGTNQHGPRADWFCATCAHWEASLEIKNRSGGKWLGLTSREQAESQQGLGMV